ncbi:MAG TPA: hypothetical protein VMJ14_02635, partial [Burkholderiales bacterium]|nr:hypothetical protein [Burkholderiales bacterium]
GKVGFMAHEHFLQRALYYFAFTSLGSTPLFYGVKRTALAREAFELVTAEMKYSGMELLLNTHALIRGKIAVLDIPFGLRDYNSETTRDPEREDPDTYLSRHDLEQVRLLLLSELAKTGGFAEETVRVMADLYITHAPPHSWTPPRNPDPEPSWLRRAKLGLALVESIVNPRSTARRHGIPPQTMIALMRAHSAFIRGLTDT